MVFVDTIQYFIKKNLKCRSTCPMKFMQSMLICRRNIFVNIFVNPW